MTAPLYNPAELDFMTADAQRLGMAFSEYVEHLQETCIGHAATLVTHPEMRAPALDLLRVQERLTTIALLEVIDQLFEGVDAHELREMLTAKADVHLAILLGDI
jgi:hypothetical protein